MRPMAAFFDIITGNVSAATGDSFPFMGGAHTCICIYTPKKGSRFGGQPCNFGKDADEVLPDAFRQQRSHSALSPRPRRAGFCELRQPAAGDLEPLLAAVLPRANGDPAGVYEGAEVSSQRGLFMHRHFAKVALPKFAGPAKQLQQRVLGRAEADATQLLIVEPADDSRRLPECQAKAWGAGRF